ncbi:MAG: guanylate cyclase soluble subunit beta [Oleiphilaceae bacterium]|jgi:guanylate cyclase soluble subunit beta
MTFQLVGAASEVLKIPAEAILEVFGEHCVLHTAQKGYGGLMQANGSSLPEFLANLPGFHTKV